VEAKHAGNHHHRNHLFLDGQVYSDVSNGVPEDSNTEDEVSFMQPIGVLILEV